MLFMQIKALYPDILDSEFRLQNDSDGKGDYIKEWNTDRFPKPTQADLDSMSSKAGYTQELLAIKSARVTEYPAIGDQLDAILKQLSIMSEDKTISLIPELQAIISDWQKVKTENPLPIEVV